VLYLSGMLVEALKRRANDFIELAVEMMGRGKHDIAAFLTEQSCQPRVKASLLRLFGDAPPTHGLRHLLGLLARGLEEAGRGDLSRRIADFVREHRAELSDMEEAYIGARYRDLEYTRAQVEEMIKAGRELHKLLEEVERGVLG